MITNSMIFRAPPKNKLDIKSFVGYIVLALLIASTFDKYLSGLRYVKYAAPIICALVFLVYKFRIYQDETTRPFLFLFLATMLLSPAGNTYGLHDTYFYITSLAPFLVGCIPKLSAKRFFQILVATFLMLSIPDMLESGFEYAILDSTSTLEDHSFAFVFGLFSIFFFLTKDKKYLFFSLILAALVLKRISLLAIIAVIAIYYIMPFVVLRRLAAIGIAVNLIYIFSAYYVTTDSFNYFSQDNFGVSSSFLTMGRTSLYDPIFSSERDLISILIGDGPGASYHIAAASIFITEGKVNLHSDVLKLYYELGIIIFLVFFFLAYKIRDIRIYILIYLNIILFTDNASTYFIVMYVYFFLSHKLREIGNITNNERVISGL